MAVIPLRRAEIGLAVLCTAIFYGEMICFGANSRLLAVVAANIQLVFALLCAFAFRRDLPEVPAWRMFVPAILLIAAAGWLAAVDLASPRRSDATFVEISKLLGAGAFCLGAAWICLRRTRMRLLMLTFVVGALIYAALCLAVRDLGSVWGVSKPLNMTRFSATLLNPNAAACVFAMLAVLSLGALLSTVERLGAESPFRTGVKALVSATALLACTGCCLMTASRAAAVLLVLVSLAVIVITLKGWRGREDGRAAVGMGTILILVLGVAASATALSVRGLDMSQSAGSRLMTVQIVWRAVLAEPLTGHGANAIPHLIEASLRPENVQALWNIRAAHFALLELAADGGLPYAVLVLAAVLAVVAQAFSASRQWGRDRALRYAAVGALTIVLACSFIDIALNVPAVAALGAAILGVLWGRGMASPEGAAGARQSTAGKAVGTRRPAAI